ncbi:hypothetical protein BUALT_Bualt11G0089200 [Buddleja alternifolia]|uniref:Late embryogenesis abundant protein LEA-2 subgroup domain-containing protein n=1 Tax=Buddleja alternifolia TaxID=168488 RepID=A0AAV6WSQ3_9LAMI|nr:hypothetical protein BUALT_Bualt11G0089200 [Buddleja alternifolia]
MAETKQPHLNGAYYGPSVPPPSKTYHRPGRGGSCNPFSCLMSCLCTCICQILITILVIVGIAVFVLWLIFRPNTVKFYATDATLTEFNLNNNNNMLNYNLALNFTVRNPNRRIGVYYDRIEARAYYQGERFAAVELPRFYQRRKSTNSLSAEFRGQHIVSLGNRERSNYDGDRSSGVYDIEVRLYMRIRMRFGVVRSPRVKPNVECDLRIPLSANGTVVGGFEFRRCDFDWR